MRIIKRILSHLLLSLALYLVVSAAAVRFTVADRSAIKSSFREADAYSQVVPAIIDGVEMFESSDQGSLSFNDPEIQEIFRRSITTEIIQTQFESFLDDAYVWLEGQQDELVFAVDLREVKANLVANISEYVVRKAQTLPPCPSIESDVMTVDVFDLQCQPPDSSTQFIEPLVQDGVSELALLETPLITQDSLVDDEGVTIGERLERARTAYQLIDPVFFASLGLFGLATLVYVWARRPLGKALRSLGKHFVFVSVIWGGGSFIAQQVVSGRLRDVAAHSDDAALLGASVAEVFIINILWIVFVVMAAVGAAGIVLWVSSRLFPNKPKKHKSHRRKLFRRRQDR